LFFGFLASAYRNGVLPSSPLIDVIFQVVVAILLISMIIFVCAIYIIAMWSIISDIRARNRFFKLNYDLRKLELEQRQQHELEQQRRETTPLGRHTTTLNSRTTYPRASRQRPVDSYRRDRGRYR